MMIRTAIVASLLVVSACNQGESVFAQLNTATVIPLDPITVEVDGKEYEVRRSIHEFPNSSRTRWAIVKDGQIISCLKPTVESCGEALRGESRGGGGGGMY